MLTPWICGFDSRESHSLRGTRDSRPMGGCHAHAMEPQVRFLRVAPAHPAHRWKNVVQAPVLADPGNGLRSHLARFDSSRGRCREERLRSRLIPSSLLVRFQPLLPSILRSTRRACSWAPTATKGTLALHSLPLLCGETERPRPPCSRNGAERVKSIVRKGPFVRGSSASTPACSLVAEASGSGPERGRFDSCHADSRAPGSSWIYPCPSGSGHQPPKLVRRGSIPRGGAGELCWQRQ